MTAIKKSLKKSSAEKVTGKQPKSVKKNKKKHSSKPSIAKLLEQLKSDTLFAAAANSFERPSFSTRKVEASRLEATLSTGVNYMKANLAKEDLAAPHRAPYSNMRDKILYGLTVEVRHLVTELKRASETYEKAFRAIKSDTVNYGRLAELYEQTRIDMENAFSGYLTQTLSDKKKASAKLELILAINNLASNAPGLGPHSTTNAPVSNRTHLHPTGLPQEPLTPRGSAAGSALPEVAVATTTLNGQQHTVSVTGDVHPGTFSSLNEDVKVKERIFRGALRVDSYGRVFRPVGVTGWEQVK